MTEKYYLIAGYTREATKGNNSMKRAYSMHLGYSEDGVTFEPLNYNTGVLYAEAQFDGDPAGTTKLLKDPYLFRTKEGSFGVIATRIDEHGEADETDRRGVLLFVSDNLLNYREVGFIKLTEKAVVSRPVCEYQANEYMIGWYDENGQFYRNSIESVHHASNVGQAILAHPFGHERVPLSIKDAHTGSIIRITKEEANEITGKLKPVTNIGIEINENDFHLIVQINKPIKSANLPESVKLTYSDGSNATKNIMWNEEELEQIDWSRQGIHTINGLLQQSKYPFPMIPNKADPNVLKYNGHYYFISTDENGQNRFLIREAATISVLPDVKETLILHIGDEIKSCLWAPELHVVKGRLCIFFAGGLAAGENGWRSVQCFIMMLKLGGNPLNMQDWERPRRVVKQDDTPLMEHHQGITLDMTYFEHYGHSFVIWAQRNVVPLGASELWIASIDSGLPWRLTSDPVKICSPNYGWERNTTIVDEGPSILKRDNNIFCTFSGSNIDDTYCVGLLMAHAADDLLRPESWTKIGYPIWTANSVKNQYGPGHNSFTEDDNGNTVNIFHAKTTEEGSRDFGARNVHWAADGTPVLDMTEDREILDLYKKITATISVEVQEPTYDSFHLNGEVFEKGVYYGTLYSYIEHGESNRKEALCLAVDKQGVITVLNGGQPVLYARYGMKKMGSPVLFRKADGSLGLVAADHQGSTYITVFDSYNGTKFTNERFVQVNRANIVVKDLSCSYNETSGVYELFWTDGTQGYLASTVDFEFFSEALEMSYEKKHSEFAKEEAAQVSRIGITENEYTALLNQYNKPRNTGIVEKFPDLSIPMGANLQQLNLPSKVTAAYSDGSTKKWAIVWDATHVDFNHTATYRLTGTLHQTRYANPFILERADPYVIYDEESGFYYFTASYPTYGHDKDGTVKADGYDRIMLRRASSLEALADADEVEVWNEENSSRNNRYIWAPELHKIKDKWYILCTASINDNVWAIRPMIIPCHGDLMDTDAWERNGKWMESDFQDGAFSAFSLDMTYFEHHGKHFIIWAEKPAGSRLYLATIDPDHPWKLTSRRLELSAPDYAWEQGSGDQIDEGPAVIKNDGRIYVCFSACTVDENYCIGYLYADENADLMNADSWTKNPFPVLSSSDFKDGQLGPGHNSFTVDAYGNPVIVYHARTKGEPGDGGLDDPGRHARIKSIHFAYDGRPVLNMSDEDEVHPDNKTISFSIVVHDESSNSGN